MNDRWFYCKEGERQGPLPFEALHALVVSRALLPSDLVWCPDFGREWRPVAEVAELNRKAAAITPPVLKVRRQAADFNAEPAGGSCRPSVAEAVDRSWRRMRMVLFRPFILARWMGIGFCAWLASFGSGSGMNFQEQAGEGTFGKSFFDEIAGKIVDFLNNPVQLSAVVIGIVFLLLLYVLILRLKSRGDFMFLRRWYYPDDTLGECWRESRGSADKFFGWRLRFYGFLLLASLLNAVYFYQSFLLPYVNSGCVWEMVHAQPLTITGVTAVLLCFVLMAGERFGVDFVVPILYWHDLPVAAAWRRVFELCNQFPGAVILYLLSFLGMWLCFAVALVLVVVMTCCIAALPLIIPYAGVVCLLPVYFFFRGYPIFFIAQWRENFIPGAEIDQ